jgi:hypothetical protein
MNSEQSPYFSFSGLAFRTPGDEMETEMNLQIAMQHLRAYVVEGAGRDEAAAALAYLQSQSPKLNPFCKEMRFAFQLDDFDDSEHKKRLMIRAYNGIVDRLNGQPVIRKSGEAPARRDSENAPVLGRVKDAARR